LRCGKSAYFEKKYYRSEVGRFVGDIVYAIVIFPVLLSETAISLTGLSFASEGPRIVTNTPFLPDIKIIEHNLITKE
jgi:hypothetical protein